MLDKDGSSSADKIFQGLYCRAVNLWGEAHATELSVLIKGIAERILRISTNLPHFEEYPILLDRNTTAEDI